MRKLKTLEDYEKDLQDMYGMPYSIVRVDEPHRNARSAIVTVRCSLHSMETTSRLTNFLAYKYGQYDIGGSYNKRVGRTGPQTVCTFPCPRCRELKLSPVTPRILSDSGRAQKMANHLFTVLRTQYQVKHVDGHQYRLKCGRHGIVAEASRSRILESPSTLCSGCHIDAVFDSALAKVVELEGDANFHYELQGYPSPETKINVIGTGSSYELLALGV